MNKYISYLLSPDETVLALAAHGLLPFLSSKKYLEIKFKLRMGYKLDIHNPLTFNEKLQWLKLYDHRPEYTMMVDKFEVKKYVSSIIGENYIIPTLGVWNTFDEIDFEKLPNQFVLKCTHDSGGVAICRDKSNFDFLAARKKINHSLKTNFYLVSREWPYKNVKPRIIAEQYLENDNEMELKDYKFMCFDSKVKCEFVCSNRHSTSGLEVTFYDTEWKRLPFERHYPQAKNEIAKPINFDEMKNLAELLSKNIPFVRIDFYEVKGKTYFGEITFFPGAGMEEFRPSEWDKTLGDWIPLRGENCKLIGLK